MSTAITVIVTAIIISRETFTYCCSLDSCIPPSSSAALPLLLPNPGSPPSAATSAVNSALRTPCKERLEAAGCLGSGAIRHLLHSASHSKYVVAQLKLSPIFSDCAFFAGLNTIAEKPKTSTVPWIGCCAESWEPCYSTERVHDRFHIHPWIRCKGFSLRALGLESCHKPTAKVPSKWHKVRHLFPRTFLTATVKPGQPGHGWDGDAKGFKTVPELPPTFNARALGGGGVNPKSHRST